MLSLTLAKLYFDCQNKNLCTLSTPLRKIDFHFDKIRKN
nr:MAG TPA: hypothetical protein [Caudoviricetes sp.]